MQNNIQEYEQDDIGMAEISQAIGEIEKLKGENVLRDEIADNQPQEEIEKELEEEVEQLSQEQGEIEQEYENELSESERDKLWRLKKEKYARIAQKQQLVQENAKLKQMLSDAVNSGTYHYGRSAYADLEKAKEYKKKAIETGDVDGLIEADIALTQAMNRVSEVAKWQQGNQAPTPRNQESNNPPYAKNAPSNELYQEMTRDWLEEHSYLQPGSRNYNPELAKQVSGFVNNLDRDIAQNNRQDLYFTPEYFDAIDGYIEQVKRGGKQNSNAVSHTNARQNMSHVGAVRGSGAPGVGMKQTPVKIQLTADEKRMAADMGVSEKVWLQEKLNELNKGKNK